jgi:hypothetical protein
MKIPRRDDAASAISSTHQQGKKSKNLAVGGVGKDEIGQPKVKRVHI